MGLQNNNNNRNNNNNINNNNTKKKKNKKKKKNRRAALEAVAGPALSGRLSIFVLCLCQLCPVPFWMPCPMSSEGAAAAAA